MRRAGTCACVVRAVFGLADSSHHATEGKVLQPAPRLVPLVVIHHHEYAPPLRVLCASERTQWLRQEGGAC